VEKAGGGAGALKVSFKWSNALRNFKKTKQTDWDPKFKKLAEEYTHMKATHSFYFPHHIPITPFTSELRLGDMQA